MTEQARPDFEAMARDLAGQSFVGAIAAAYAQGRASVPNDAELVDQQQALNEENATLRAQLATVTAERDEAQRVLAAYRKYLFPTTLQRDEARARVERLTAALEQIERGKASLARDELIEFMRDTARAALAEVRDHDNG